MGTTSRDLEARVFIFGFKVIFEFRGLLGITCFCLRFRAILDANMEGSFQVHVLVVPREKVQQMHIENNPSDTTIVYA